MNQTSANLIAHSPRQRETQRPRQVFCVVSPVVLCLLTFCFWGTATYGQSLTNAKALEDVQAIEAAIGENLARLEQATVCLQGALNSGSGVIVSADGLILTAAHVVGDNETMIVRFHDDSEVTCKVLGTYGPADAAMAKIIDQGTYVFAQPAKTGTIRDGATLIAMGNPNGFDLQRGMPLRIGHIHTINPEFFTSDAALIRGDSGGPSFNLKGEVIGIHSNVGQTITENNDTRIGAFHKHWDALLSGVRRGQVLVPESTPDQLVVGMQLMLPESGQAARVSEVIPQTPAAWAGVQANDEIITVNGTAIENSIKFLQGAKDGQWGTTLKLQIRRQDETIQRTIKLLTYDQIVAQRKKRATDPDAALSEQPSDEDATKDLSQAEQSKSGTRLEQQNKQNDSADPQPQHQDEDLGDSKNKSQPDSMEEKPPADDSSADDSPADDSPAKASGMDRKSELKRLLAEARKNGGRLKIDRAKLLELNRQLGKRMDKLSRVGGRMSGNWTKQFQQAFSAQVGRYAQSVFPVNVTGRLSAVAVAVSDQGHFITKASEVEGRKFQIVIRDDLRLDAVQVAVDPDNDLVLLKTAPGGPAVRPVDFVNDAATESSKGKIVCCLAESNETLAGFGVISCNARALDGASGAILGLTTEKVEQGLKITQAPEMSPAGLAGLKADDIIIDFDGQTVKTPEDISKIVANHLPDEEVNITIIRDGDNYLSVVAKLGSRSKLAPMAGSREQDLDRDAAKLSRRRWSFTQGIQHDCAIRPRDCGGLLVDLQGNVVGVNISRSGRVKSYALPASLVAKFVKQSINQ